MDSNRQVHYSLHRSSFMTVRAAGRHHLVLMNIGQFYTVSKKGKEAHVSLFYDRAISPWHHLLTGGSFSLEKAQFVILLPVKISDRNAKCLFCRECINLK